MLRVALLVSSLLFVCAEGSWFSSLIGDTPHKCPDGSTVDASLVDDNFCDCGTDEPNTAACSGSVGATFQCRNEGFLPRSVPSGFVDDGVCDCCDGSDEIATHADCQNTCGERALAYIKQHIARVTHYEKALVARSKMLRASRKKTKSLKKRIKVLKKRVKKGDKTLQTAQARGVKPGSKEFERMSMLYQSIREMQGEKSMLEAFVYGIRDEDGNPLPALTGEEGEYLSLMDKCFALPWSKRRYGEHGMIEDKYVYQLCPLRNATQYNEVAWNLTQGIPVQQQRKDSSAKQADVTGGLDAEQSTTEEVDAAEMEEPSRFSLGRFAGWADDASQQTAASSTAVDSADAEYSGTMMYVRGDKCWNGPERSVSVRTQCGTNTELTSVRENGKCSYELTLSTPAACSATRFAQLTKQTDVLKQRFRISLADAKAEL